MTSSLGAMMSYPLLESSRYAKWGFFSALLDAEDGDSLQTGSLILITKQPYIQYRAAELLWLENCDQIMVGSRRLSEYFDYVLTQPTSRELPAEYWRDTSPKYYILSGENTLSRRYVDGTNVIDLPDFHSLDFSVSSPFMLIGGNVSSIVDRFGNQYASGGAVAGLSTPMGLTYSEGYICAHGSSGDCFFKLPSLENDSDLVNIISGPCVSLGAALDLGGSIFGCAPTSAGGYRGGGIIFSAGLNATIGAASSATWHMQFLGSDQSKSWNWAIEDRLEGIGYVELMVKSKTER